MKGEFNTCLVRIGSILTIVLWNEDRKPWRLSKLSKQNQGLSERDFMELLLSTQVYHVVIRHFINRKIKLSIFVLCALTISCS